MFAPQMAEDYAYRYPELQQQLNNDNAVNDEDNLFYAMLRRDLWNMLPEAFKQGNLYDFLVIPAYLQCQISNITAGQHAILMGDAHAQQISFNSPEYINNAEQRYEQLMPSQKHMVDTILAAVDESINMPDSTSRLNGFFVDAPGGTGKTFCFNTIVRKLRAAGKHAICCASSGVAAVLLDNGGTFHSRFKAPLNADENSTLNIESNSELADAIRQAHIIIWDEAPMSSKHLLNALDLFLRDIGHADMLFGGKVVVLGGDFRQILPVVRGGNPAKTIDVCLQKWQHWSAITTLKLEENMRILRLGNSPAAQEYAQWIMRLGEGAEPYVDQPQNIIAMPANYCLSPSTIDSLINWVYDDFAQNYSDPEWIAKRAILAPKNSLVNSINQQIINDIPSSAAVTTCTSVDKLVDMDNVDSGEFLNSATLNSFSPPGLPPHVLTLKEGMPVMLIRNLQPAEGLCNGTRLIVKKVVNHKLLVATVLSNPSQQVFIPRISLNADPNDFGFAWKRKQFPVVPAFAMTINKAQGQTIAKAGIALTEDCFSHGQLYVAASRVGHPDHIKFITKQDQNQYVTKNIVYQQILS
jgi:hypothetical protein